MTEHQFRGRREDQRLVTGRGRYTADHEFPGQVAGIFSAPTARMPGSSGSTSRRREKASRRARHPDRRRHGRDRMEGRAGHGVFQGRRRLVVAGAVPSGPGDRARALRRRAGGADRREDRAIAQDAAELVAVEYEDLPVYVTAGAALARRRADPRGRGPAIWRSTTSTAIAPAPSPAFQGRGACRARRAARPAHLRQSDGAEVLHRALRRRGRDMYDLHSDPGHLGHRATRCPA